MAVPPVSETNSRSSAMHPNSTTTESHKMSVCSEQLPEQNCVLLAPPRSPTMEVGPSSFPGTRHSAYGGPAGRPKSPVHWTSCCGLLRRRRWPIRGRSRNAMFSCHRGCGHQTAGLSSRRGTRRVQGCAPGRSKFFSGFLPRAPWLQ